MMLWLVGSALALTLNEAVQRAESVSPEAIIAALQAKQARLDAVESWVQLGVSPSVTVSRTWVGGASADRANFTVSSDALNPGAWFDATHRSAQARAATWLASGAQLDAQYAVALLYYGVVSTQAALSASEADEVLAAGTQAAVAARVGAGLDSQLVGKQAEAALLSARAQRQQAAANLVVSRLQLARALQLDQVGEVGVAPTLDLPEAASTSPYLSAAKAELSAARLDHAQDLARLLPSGSISAGTPLDPLDWSVTLGATWTLDGIVGPVVRERTTALQVQVAEVQLDALERDVQLGIAVASAQAEAAVGVAGAAAARESLAAEALKVGQVRLGAGLASGIEVLLLQAELAQARADAVANEFVAAAAVLEARRLAGIRWTTAE